jgi:two-component system alkaline phosphatase synthesis response regulator PhoP
MSRERLLVVDDEEDILELVQYNLHRSGYDVTAVSSGEEALKAARSARPDLVVLDLMLPGVDGLEVCRLLKRDVRTSDLPIVMLTARGEEGDIVKGLELGADDYVTKPFSPKVLVARVRAVLRRRGVANADETQRVEQGSLVIDPRRHEVLVDGAPVVMTATEFRIVHLLARRPGWVFTRQQIIDAVQGEDVAVTLRSVDVHVVALRRKLGAAGDLIETVRGVGYRFHDENTKGDADDSGE